MTSESRVGVLREAERADSGPATPGEQARAAAYNGISKSLNLFFTTIGCSRFALCK
jgi:hypothetical protein